MCDMKRVHMSYSFLVGNGCIELYNGLRQSLAHIGAHHGIVKGLNVGINKGYVNNISRNTSFEFGIAAEYDNIVEITFG